MDRSRRRRPSVISLPRRSVLRALAAAAGGAAVAQALLATGCADMGPEGGRDSEARIPLSGLAEGERRVIDVAGRPVEIVRRANGVDARSLTCTHWGCRVRWDAQEGAYRCPCHGGRFAPDGRVISGPPPRPLPPVPVTVAGGQVVIRASDVPRAAAPSPA